MAGGFSYKRPTRIFRNFFGRYGSVGASIRGVWDGIIPVAVVDRYRDDTEGSHYGLRVNYIASGNTGFAAIAMGSPSDDWELDQLTIGAFVPSFTNVQAITAMIYTPDAFYVPVVNPQPATISTPGLQTDFSFTLGSVTGVGGWNPTLPARWGHILGPSIPITAASPGSTIYETYRFNPPIRVYRDVTLGILFLNNDTAGYSGTVSALYRIRPRTTDGPKTGP